MTKTTARKTMRVGRATVFTVAVTSASVPGTKIGAWRT